jgi:hypothetical protein
MKLGAKHDYDGTCAKILSGPCSAHSDIDHTMGDYKGIKSIFRSDARKRARGEDKGDDLSDHRDKDKADDEAKDAKEQEKNPCHAYRDPNKIVYTIFGVKVVLETGRERKLITRAVLVVVNSDEKIIDPKYHNWSHRAITFSRADQWAKIPELDHFPLVLDPVIGNVRFEKVLIDRGCNTSGVWLPKFAPAFHKHEHHSIHYAFVWLVTRVCNILY